MNAQELIAALSKVDPMQEVCVCGPNYDDTSNDGKVIDVVKEATQVVYLRCNFDAKID